MSGLFSWIKTVFSSPTEAEQSEMLGMDAEALRRLSNEKLIMLTLWRLNFYEYTEMPLMDELYRRATGKEPPQQDE